MFPPLWTCVRVCVTWQHWLLFNTYTPFVHVLVLLGQVEYLRGQLAKSVAEETRLGEGLKRTQESLLFLSAWDEEKIELESEVSSRWSK